MSFLLSSTAISSVSTALERLALETKRTRHEQNNVEFVAAVAHILRFVVEPVRYHTICHF